MTIFVRFKTTRSLNNKPQQVVYDITEVKEGENPPPYPPQFIKLEGSTAQSFLKLYSQWKRFNEVCNVVSLLHKNR